MELYGYCCPTLDEDSAKPGATSVLFNLGSYDGNQSLGYWVYSNDDAAEKGFDDAMTGKQTQLPVMTDMSRTMHTKSQLRTTSDARAAGCYILLDNVVVLGSSVGIDPTWTNGDNACNLALVAAKHLSLVITSLK